MSYAALSDVQKLVDDDVLVQLTDDAGAGTVDAALVAEHLDLASVEIDGYLGSRYSLPLSSAPAILTNFCVDIAVFNMYSRRQGPPEYWQKRYDNAVAFLKMVAAGKITLGAGDPDGNAEKNTPQMSGPDRIFTRDGMKGF